MDLSQLTSLYKFFSYLSTTILLATFFKLSLDCFKSQHYLSYAAVREGTVIRLSGNLIVLYSYLKDCSESAGLFSGDK